MSTREDILLHLESLLAGVTPITGVYRDRADLPKEKCPGVILLDGREEIAMQLGPQNRPKMPPAIFALKPQIFVICKLRDDMRNETLGGLPAPIGPELTMYRDQILALIVNDPTLVSLVTETGKIIYMGCETDMQTGSSMEGQLRMDFEFHYVLFPPTG